MDISRELAIKILKYLDQHKDFYFPFLVMNKEYTEEDDDFVEIEPSEWEMIEEDSKYQTFQLWENLQNLDDNTTQLLAKGFLEKINNESSTIKKKYICLFCNAEKEKLGITREELNHYSIDLETGQWEDFGDRDTKTKFIRYFCPDCGRKVKDRRNIDLIKKLL